VKSTEKEVFLKPGDPSGKDDSGLFPKSQPAKARQGGNVRSPVQSKPVPPTRLIEIRAPFSLVCGEDDNVISRLQGNPSLGGQSATSDRDPRLTRFLSGEKGKGKKVKGSDCSFIPVEGKRLAARLKVYKGKGHSQGLDGNFCREICTKRGSGDFQNSKKGGEMKRDPSLPEFGRIDGGHGISIEGIWDERKSKRADTLCETQIGRGSFLNPADAERTDGDKKKLARNIISSQREMVRSTGCKESRKEP